MPRIVTARTAPPPPAPLLNAILALQNPANTGARRVLVPGAQVPRVTNDEEWPYVLLAPKANQIELMAFGVLER